MFHSPTRWALFAIVMVCCAASAQIARMAAPGGGISPLEAIQSARLDLNLFRMGSYDPRTTEIQSPDGSVSWLDLKAPDRPRREYEKGYQSLMQRRFDDAVDDFDAAIRDDPKYFAAHNALGTTYLDMGEYRRAKSEFTTAAALDGHLPNSYLNLGCAELGLKQYPEAEESLRKSSALAPLDPQLRLALIYAEFLNRKYSAVLETSRMAHEPKHDGAAVAHLFVAGAWEALGHPAQAAHEMDRLLRADPDSPFASQFRQVLEQLNRESARPAESTIKPACEDCDAAGSGHPSVPGASASENGQPSQGLPADFQLNENEVSIQFAAMDHGRSVTDLAVSDVRVLDEDRPPGAILEFRNESHLPLRLGIVIDTSNSIVHRFSYEQTAANRFLRNTLTGSDDLAFVVGFNSTVLLAQDFTADRALIARAVDELAPGGSTALWDAVAFAADKLQEHPETGPVARVLVVLSDGDDNSSSTTLRQVIARAQAGEEAVYSICSQEPADAPPLVRGSEVGLKTLSELTGGALFPPVPFGGLDQSFAQLWQMLRGRYLIAYRPAGFERDGTYRSVEIEARKGGRKFSIFARRGYYASAAAPAGQPK